GWPLWRIVGGQRPSAAPQHRRRRTLGRNLPAAVDGAGARRTAGSGGGASRGLSLAGEVPRRQRLAVGASASRRTGGAGNGAGRGQQDRSVVRDRRGPGEPYLRGTVAGRR